MDPVAGVVDRNDLSVAEMADAAILLGVGGPALLAIDQEGRAGGARPQRLGLLLGHPVRPVGADVIVKFPAVGAILVLVDAVLGQVPRLLRRQMRVRFLHPPQRLFDRAVAPRYTPRQRALLVDPASHAVG